MGYTVTPDKHGRPPTVRFDTPMDFVQYVRDLDAGKYEHLGIPRASDGARRQAQEIAQNPNGWVMSNGHPRKKDDWLARNLPWIGPTAVGLAIGAPYLPELLSGGGPGGGVLPSSRVPGAMNTITGPGAITSQGASRGVPAYLASRHLPTESLMGGPGRLPPSQNISRRISPGGYRPGDTSTGDGGPEGRGARDWVADLFTDPTKLMSLAGLIPALMSRGGGDGGGSAADRDFLNRAYEDAQRLNALKETRFRRVDPLHEAVTQLAFNRLPTNSREGITLNRMPLPEQR